MTSRRPTVAPAPGVMRTTGWADYALLDSGDGNSMTYLPLDKIIDKSGAKKPANDNAPSADYDNVGGDMPSSSSGSQNNGDSASGNNGQSNTSNYESQALRSRSRNS